MRWLKQLLRPAPPPAPVLLRVGAGGAPPPAVVELEATWQPSGRRTRRTLRTAAGLCVMPWLGDERGVRLEVRAPGGAAELRIHRDRPDRERVHDVSLSPP